MKPTLAISLAVTLIGGSALGLIGCSLPVADFETPSSILGARSRNQRQFQQPSGKTTPSKNLSDKDAAKACVATAREFKAEGLEAQAIAMFERAREFDPGIKGISQDLATLYDRAGEYYRAEREYELAIKSSPKDSDLHNDFGFFHYQRGDFSAAEAEFHEAIRHDERNERAWTNLGMALAKLERWNDSVAAFARASGPAAAFYNVAVFQARAGHLPEAIANADEALQRQPTLDQARVLKAKLTQMLHHQRQNSQL